MFCATEPVNNSGGCVYLDHIDNIENWNVTYCKSMRATFFACLRLNHDMDLSKWDTASLEDTSYMFGQAFWFADKEITLKLPNSKNPNLKTVRSMFYENVVNHLDITNFNIGNATDLQYMIAGGHADLDIIGTIQINDSANVYRMFYDSGLISPVSIKLGNMQQSTFLSQSYLSSSLVNFVA